MSLEEIKLLKLLAETERLRTQLINLRNLLEKRNAQLAKAVELRRKGREAYVRRMEFPRSTG